MPTHRIDLADRNWWVEGHVPDTEVWHPMYGPLVEATARSLRNRFLEWDDQRMVSCDPALLEYDDFRVRADESVPKYWDQVQNRRYRFRLNNFEDEYPVAAKAMKKAGVVTSVQGDSVVVKEPSVRAVAHPIRSSQTKIRVKKKKRTSA